MRQDAQHQPARDGRRRLLTADVPVETAAIRDVTLDDFDSELFGRWNGTFPEDIAGLPLRYSEVFYGPGIHRDMVVRGKVAPARARFQPLLPRRTLLDWPRFPPRPGTSDQYSRHDPPCGWHYKSYREPAYRDHAFPLVPLGEFTFHAGDGGFVEITNHGTDGRVAIDSMRWIWLG